MKRSNLLCAGLHRLLYASRAADFPRYRYLGAPQAKNIYNCARKQRNCICTALSIWLPIIHCMPLPIFLFSTIYDTSSFSFFSADGRLLDPSTTVRYELLLGKKKKVFGVFCMQSANKQAEVVRVPVFVRICTRYSGSALIRMVKMNRTYGR